MAKPEESAPFVAHFSEIEGDDSWTYPNSSERFAFGAKFSKKFGLMRLGIHHERLPPGRRLSWPHAEADEEEFVYIIEGTPDVWIDGYLRRLKPGDGVGFPAGTGIAHTFLNNSESDVRLLVVGEASRERSRIDYPLHPKRNAGDRRKALEGQAGAQTRTAQWSAGQTKMKSVRKA